MYTEYFKMRPATPFHSQMKEIFGEYATQAEPLLWFGSVVIGMIACKIAYEIMKILSPIYFASYRRLPRIKQVEWDNRGMSTTHAFFCTLAAGYLIFISDVFADSAPYGLTIFRSTVLSYVTMAISTGYFLADLSMILWCYPHLGGVEYVLHHLLSIGSLMLANHCAHSHFYLLLVLFSECSTPFINLRWYLLSSGLKDSKAFMYNGLVVLFVWLWARVILFIYFFYHIYTHFDQMKLLYPPGFYFMFTAPPILAVMNLFWFYKIVSSAVKVLHKKRD